MERRTFLQMAPLSAAAMKLLADTPMPMTTLGKSGLKVSRFVVGGAHMVRQGDEEAVRILRRALDLGVTFFDSAHLYANGRSDEMYGKAFTASERQKVVLMSKAQLYTRDAAMKQLEETLRRMKTDYLDLWQCHQVSTHEDADTLLGPGGSLEAFVQAKKQGKVRHIGFTGHRDPTVHQRLMEATGEWETIQFPVNLVDPHYLSFIDHVLPKAKAKGLGILAMKSNAMGGIGAQKIAPIQECIRFTLSHNPHVLVSGVETVGQLEENVLVVKTFERFSPAEVSEILKRTKTGPIGTKVERYKKPESGQAAVYRDGMMG